MAKTTLRDLIDGPLSMSAAAPPFANPKERMGKNKPKFGEEDPEPGSNKKPAFGQEKKESPFGKGPFAKDESESPFKHGKPGVNVDDIDDEEDDEELMDDEGEEEEGDDSDVVDLEIDEEDEESMEDEDGDDLEDAEDGLDEEFEDDELEEEAQPFGQDQFGKKPPQPGAPAPGMTSPTASPLAQNVANHLQDPVGATKQQFDRLNEAQMQYELAKQTVKRELAPVKSVIQIVEQQHGLSDDEAQGYQEDPSQGMPGGGMPGGGMPGGGMPGMGGGMPPKPPGQQFPAGNSPGPQSSKFPPKMGQNEPGGGDKAGFPSSNNNPEDRFKQKPKPFKMQSAGAPGVLNVKASSRTLKASAYVGSLHADHQMGIEELRQKLHKALTDKYPVRRTGYQIDPMPWIREVYPFENYLIYDDGSGKLYKHKFRLNKVERSVSLEGSPTEVVQRYLNASGKKKKVYVNKSR